MIKYKDVAGSRYVIAVAQVAIVACLLIIYVSVRGLEGDAVDDRAAAETDRAKTETVANILASTCGVASFRELRAQGLVEECRLAQSGELPDEIPEADLRNPAEAVDVLPDDENATPADVLPVGDGSPATTAQVTAAVITYLDRNPLPSTPGYDRAIRRAVNGYMMLNPPPVGQFPTTQDVQDAVRTAILANPPTDGTPGADGVAVADATIAGCDVVFTFSDGSTATVGPLCGPQGEPGPPPSTADLVAAFDTYCTANGECRGASGPSGPAGPTGVVTVLDECTPEAGQFITDVTPTYDPDTRTVTIACTSGPGGGPPPG